MTSRLNLRQIAQLARTSKSSVSRVLTNHPNVSAATRERIEKVIKKYGYRPNLFARGLAGGRTGLIAVISAEIESGFYAKVLRGIDQVVNEHGGHVLSSFSHGTQDYVQFWQHVSRTRQVDGVILIAPPLEVFAADLRAQDLPAVLCAARPPAHSGKGWNRVSTATVNNREAMKELLRALEARGLRRVAYFAGPPNVFDANERRLATEEFVAAHPAWKTDWVQADHTSESGYRIALDYLRGHAAPQAIICFNDATAYGVLQALRELGLPPHQILVTGCDDEPTAAAMVLTTLHMPMAELGQAAARLLMEGLAERVERPVAQHAVVDMHLTWRGGE